MAMRKGPPSAPDPTGGKAWGGRFRERQTVSSKHSPLRWRSIGGSMPMTFKAASPIARRWGRRAY